MVRKRPIKHERTDVLPVPTLIAMRYKRVQMFMDIFFVNKLVFLHTKSENINYRSVQALKSHNMTEILQGINIVKNKYEARGFELKCWHTNNEFNRNDVIDTVSPAKLETYAQGEHVGVVKIFHCSKRDSKHFYHMAKL